MAIYKIMGTENSDKNFTHRHLEDVKRMQRVLQANGYHADLDDCARLWDDYSDMYAAGWLGLPSDDDELLNTLINQL